jgi:ABC-type sugar transport system substrate-binding protein
VVGIDATYEAVRAVQGGRLAGDIAMFPERLGGDAVEAALKAARGQPLEKRVEVGEALVTKENAASFLPQNLSGGRSAEGNGKPR